MMGFKVELKYPIQNSIATTISGVGQRSGPQSDVIKYHKKNGSLGN